MKALILAAGFGKRLQPITKFFPKAIVPVINFPLIEFNIRLLAHYGINDLIINTHYLPKHIQKCLGNGKKYAAHIQYIHEPEILGTAGAIKNISKLLGNEPLLVLNSDIIVDIDIGALLQYHKENGGIATLVVKKHPQQKNFGTLGLNDTCRIRKFLDTKHPDDAKNSIITPIYEEYMFTGVQIIEPAVREYIPPDIFCTLGGYVYPKLLSHRESLHGFVYNGYWNDLGHILNYFQTNMSFMNHEITLHYWDPICEYQHKPNEQTESSICLGKNIIFGKNIEMIPPIMIHDKVTIEDGCTIGPKVIIGAGSKIEKQSKISHSVILPKSHVGLKSEIHQSIYVKKNIIPIERN